MTFASSLFSSLSKNDITCSIYNVDGSLMNVNHKGSISMSSLSLLDTYLIHKLIFNLISIGTSCDLGYELTFYSFRCRVQDTRTRQLIGTGCKIKRLFELIQLHVPHESNIYVASKYSYIQLWHRRLSHNFVRKLRPLCGTLFYRCYDFNKDNNFWWWQIITS